MQNLHLISRVPTTEPPTGDSSRRVRAGRTDVNGRVVRARLRIRVRRARVRRVCVVTRPGLVRARGIEKLNWKWN